MFMSKEKTNVKCSLCETPVQLDTFPPWSIRSKHGFHVKTAHVYVYNKGSCSGGKTQLLFGLPSVDYQNPVTSYHNL